MKPAVTDPARAKRKNVTAYGVRCPPLAHRTRWCHGLLTALALSGGCNAGGLPPSEDVPEPTSGLRPPEQRGAVPEDAAVVDYQITARLDDAEHTVEGRVRMLWRNRTSRTVRQLPFHLYMNAFRASDTEWMKEARGDHRGQEFEAGAWGFIDVHGVRLRSRSTVDVPVTTQLTTLEGEGLGLKFREDLDPTTMTVDLDAPVGPGESIVVDVEFTTRLPRVFARTGHADDFHMVGQWFPKIGVLEEEGGWQAHTFSLNDEFYADFGAYDVTLDVSSEQIVGATGYLVEELPGDEGRKTLHYRAEMVHDFAWVASPHFLVHTASHDGIRIRQLIFKEHAADAAAHLEIQRATLDSMQPRYGAYPWSTITIVHVPEGAEGAGGMEYPTLYTTSDIAPTQALPGWILEERFSGLATTVHEFGHQYFQGLFASNESKQPWLDEGMNSYSNMQVYEDTFGVDAPLAVLLGHKLTIHDTVRLSLAGASSLDPVDQPASAFREDIGSYGAIVYQKTTAVMLTLRGLLGAERFDACIADYAARARFKHPTGAWLEAAFKDRLGARVSLGIVGETSAEVFLDLDRYFDQALRSTAIVDFEVRSVLNRVAIGDAGWHRPTVDGGADAALALGTLIETEAGDRETKRVSAAKDEDVEGVVVVARRGDFRIPVEILVEFEEGEPQLKLWEGEDEHVTLVFPGRRVKRAILDPASKLLLEFRRNNNARVARGRGTGGDGVSQPMSAATEGVSLALLGALAP